MSLRAGQLTKESKGWVNDIDVGGLNELARDRNRLCIEVSYVGACVSSYT
jgi:terminal uridylyltransferase